MVQASAQAAIKQVRKRDGSVVSFDEQKIVDERIDFG